MPFFSEYQNKLQNGESLFYSWNSGLGVNFMSLWAYYLSSPLNLIIVFFPQKYLNGVVSFLIITKIALSSFTMAIYLKNAIWAQRRTRKIVAKDWQVFLFSMAYALSSYMIGYSWNVMWLETMIFLPLIILGVEKLIEKNDGRWYCLFLFASLYCNFYMTFMTCLFLVLYFLLYPHKSVKKFFQKKRIYFCRIFFTSRRYGSHCVNSNLCRAYDNFLCENAISKAGMVCGFLYDFKFP